MRYTALFPTRRCNRNCVYCGSKKVQREEASIETWIMMIKHLYDCGSIFHTLLGNELFLLGDGLVKIVESLRGRQDYAIYSAFPKKEYLGIRTKLLDAEIYNISAGIDILSDNLGSIGQKSLSGLQGLLWFKNRGVKDVHGTITLHKASLPYVIQIADILSEHGIAMAVNTLHWNSDGEFDFFATESELKELQLTNEDFPQMKIIANTLSDGVKSGKYNMLNSPEYFDLWLDGGYKCKGGCTKPLLLGVDSDGSLRLCGYRKGNLLCRYNVMDLGNKLPLEKYYEIWQEDRKSCPGCFWIYYLVSEQTADIYGRQAADNVLTHHANPYRR